MGDLLLEAMQLTASESVQWLSTFSMSNKSSDVLSFTLFSPTNWFGATTNENDEE
jgi:hypothetical protein